MSTVRWHHASPASPNDWAPLMARLRRRYRSLEWDRHVRLYGWGYALRVAAKFPLRALRDAWRGVRRYGAAVAASHGVSPARQLIEQSHLRLRYGLSPEAYYRFQLFLPERRAQAGAYIDPTTYLLLIERMLEATPGGARALLRDKSAFQRWCTEHQLPTTLDIASFVDGEMVDPMSTLPHADLFSKPTPGSGGRAARIWRHDGAGRWSSGAHQHFDAAALFDVLREESRTEPMLLQICLRVHSDVAGLSTGGVNTVRFVTCRDAAGEVSLLLALYRMTAGGSAADNFDCGGLAAPVDLVSGRLGAAVQKDPRLCAARHDRHPDTGAAITGTALPLWGESCELVVRAHRLLPEIAIVGWDVALTPNGPVFVEGNNQPCCVLSQMPSGIPFGRSAFASIFEEHLRRRLDDPARRHLVPTAR